MEYFSDTMRHLICVPYSRENLHRMAEYLGIKKCWFDPKPYPHYDIPKNRIDEIHSKTTVIRSTELVRKILDEINEQR